MEKEALLKLFDQDQRINVDFPGVIKERSQRVISHRNPDGERGFIAYSKLDEASADAEIDAQVQFFASRGLDFEWKVFDHDRPADLRERLKARGFMIEDPEALVVLDLDEAPDMFWTAALPHVERITTAEGIDKIRQMEDAVWGTDHAWLNDRLVKDLRDYPDLLSVYAVTEGERAVSAAWIYFHPPSQFASLWGGSTLAAYRHRGYYTALLLTRAREARQRGYRFLTVDASPMSRPILEKYGFQFLGFSTPCIWKNRKEAPVGGSNG